MSGCAVRNGIARIEVDQEALTDALKKKDKICTALKECGFDYVTLDLEGFPEREYGFAY